MVSPKVYMQVTSRKQNGLFRQVCAHDMYRHALTINVKRGNKFEGEWEGQAGGFGEKEEKGDMLESQ